MTVSTTITKNSYSANGTLHSFAYGFKIFADADLTVIVRSSAGTETIKTLNTHYVVTNAGTDGGGNVLFKFNTGTPSDAHYSTTDQRPQSGETVVILRTLTKSQGTDYVENDPFPSTSHEDALDRLTFITQELQEEVDRTIKLSKTNTMTSPEFTVGASDRANKILAFDTSGELSVTQELGTYKGTDATVTTEAYVVRDIIKSTTAGQLNNVYICISDAVVGDSLTDTDHFELLIDAVTAATSATNAASSATASASSATAAASSASTASTQASNASTSASTASTQATNAASSATAASNAQAAAEAALDTFDDRFLGAKASDPTVDNDGNALLDGALYFDTTNDIMKVYDLTNTQWRQLTLTSTNQNNVNTVAGAISNVNTVAGANSNISTVASDISDINTVAGISSNITTVAGISSNVTSVAGNSTNINSAVSNATNINTVAGAISNVNTVGSGITNVNTVASNISGVNSFADRYRVASSAPSSSLDVGDLYFDTTANELKVYKSSGWAAAGSTVNGTSARFHYDIGSAVTSVTGSDANGNTLAYDAGFIDVYVNGVRMSTADVTITSGDTVTFASALADGDEVDIVAFGTFAVANIVSTGALNSGSITSGFGNIDNGTSTLTTGNSDINGTLNVQGETTLQTHLNMGDNDIIKVGDSADLQIYHDGSHSYVKDNGTGNLLIQGSTAIVLEDPDGNNMIYAEDGGPVYLYNNGSQKLATTSTGIDVTGNILTSTALYLNSLSVGSMAYFSYGGGNPKLWNTANGALLFGTNNLERMRIDSAGHVTMPNQPAFLVRPSSQQTNITNDAQHNQVAFGTEIFDQNSDFASNTFTAPVTGKYQLDTAIYTENLDSAAGALYIVLKTSNREYLNVIDPDFGQDAVYWTFSLSVLADMDANDTVDIKIVQSGGVSQTDINASSYFSGFLAC
jgi:hypothetical protein